MVESARQPGKQKRSKATRSFVFTETSRKEESSFSEEKEAERHLSLELSLAALQAAAAKKSFASFLQGKKTLLPCTGSASGGENRGANTMVELKKWFQQPTTVAGFSALSGTLIALLLKQMGLAEALPLLVGAAISMILPDNTAARQDAVDLARQVTAAAAQRKGTAL